MKGWLDKYGKEINANEGRSSAPENWIGEGYSNVGRNYSPAWGGQFAMGGSIPGTVGFTYARTKGIPSNGPYAKKTKASAQTGEIISQTDPEVEQARQSMFDFYSNRPANLSGDIASGAVQNVNIEEIPLKRLQKQNAYGLYYPDTNTIGYNNQTITPEGYLEDPYNELQTLKHEIGHSVYESLPKNEQQIIEESIISPKEFKERFPKGNMTRSWSKYVTKPTEFYTRRNRMFDVFEIDPSQPITDEKAQEMIDFRKWMGSSTSPEEKAELLKNHPNFNKYLENYEGSENKPEISDFMNSIKNDVPTYKRVFNEVTAVPGEQVPIAQNGMTYYQHGLDWKPKSISRDGSDIPKNQNAKYQVPSFNMPRAASESTATMFFDPVTKRMVSTATTGQKKEDVKASTEAMGNAKKFEKEEEKKRVAERKSAVAAKDKGQAFTLPSGETKKYEDMDTREKMYVSGKALEQRGRMYEDEESFLDEYINPLNLVGSMAGGLGTAPYQAQQSDSNLPYLTAIGAPLVTGAFAGIGAKNVKQFVNNLTNPLAGINVGEVPKSTSLSSSVESIKPNFQSEIDWAKWNPETPNYPELINEYNTIEESAKKTGTWMKNADGSSFQGTPEQFIQQQSSHFKKAFPEGVNRVYRGVSSSNNNPDFSKGYIEGDKGIFTANKELAGSYTYGNNKENILTPFSSSSESGIYDLGFPKGNQIDQDALSSYWTKVNLSGGSSKLNLQLHLDRLKKLAKEYDIKDFSEINSLEDRIKNYDNVFTNKEELNKLRQKLGDKPSTDQIAEYIPNTNLNNVTLRNILDGGKGDITIVNNKPGNYLKSMVGNVGFFDMTNPNVYKGLVPAGIVGTAALQKQKRGGVIKDDMGQWAHPGEITEIGSNQITMQGVPYPVLGVSDEGDVQMMYPGEDYEFEGKKVTEYPMAQTGYVQPSSADSAALYNNTMALLNYYGNKKKYKNQGVYPVPYDVTNLNMSSMKDMQKRLKDPKQHPFTARRWNSNLNVAGSLIGGLLGADIETDQLDPDYDFKMSDYYQRLSPYQYKQRETADVILDTDAPMGLYDTRIQPTREYNYLNIDDRSGPIAGTNPLHGDIVTFYGYDPALIKPWNMLTDKEKALRSGKPNQSSITTVNKKSNPVPNKPQVSNSKTTSSTTIQKTQPKKTIPLRPFTGVIEQPQPKLKRKVSKMEPISTKKSSSPSLRMPNIPNVELPGVQMGDYEVSYYSPESKDWANRRFTSQEESDRFAQEMSQRGYPGSYGNVTQTKKTNKKSTGGWLDKYN